MRNRVLELRQVKASELLENPKNWRTHPTKQKAALRGLMSEVGIAGAVIARQLPDGRLMLVDGHLRKETLGDQDVPVLVLDVDEAEADKLLATLDPLAAMAGRSDDQLRELLKSVTTQDAALSKMLERMRAVGVRAETPDELVEVPIAQHDRELGQVWQLGDHRLHIADALEPADLDGHFDAVVTDPPYAIYGSSSGIGADIADDKMVQPFFRAMLQRCNQLTKVFGHIYVFCDWRSYPTIVDQARRAAGLTLKNALVWDKGAGLGGMYSNAYELIAFFSKMPKATALKGGKPAGERTVSKPNVLRYQRPHGDERQHNAAKPVPLLEELIQNSTDLGQRVADPFCGSGSTLIACEKLGRKCVTIELDPANADIAIRRWETWTGRSATLAP